LVQSTILIDLREIIFASIFWSFSVYERRLDCRVSGRDKEADEPYYYIRRVRHVMGFKAPTHLYLLMPNLFLWLSEGMKFTEEQ